jgi:Subtilase family
MRTASKVLVLGLIAAMIGPTSSALAGTKPKPFPARRFRPSPALSVVALIDTGINPYSKAFRDNSPFGRLHPSKYLQGFPKKAKALRLSLNLPYAKAIKKDAKVWAKVRPNELYWIPGTRISGAISLGVGGARCPVVDVPPANSVGSGCEEHVLLDDHGHGSMTASRAAGDPSSLSPDARIVMIEGLGAQSVEWAAEQGWIDVQSNSWINLVPPPLPSAVSRAFEDAAKEMLTLAGSGNGTAFVTGFAPTPTYLLSTAPPGVVLVGGHDNGQATMWSGAPPHIVADAYAGKTAIVDSSGGMKPDPIACCTSAASPYAAGGAAAIVLEARELLNDSGTGTSGGIVSCGTSRGIKKGPLSDGVFTLGELKRVLFATAQARPAEGRDDGLVHWGGEPRVPDYPEYGPGANPFCIGCTTMPIPWATVPDQASAYQFIGYGGINEHSVALAKKVLRGKVAMPERPNEDTQYELDQEIRKHEFSLNEESAEATEKRPARACVILGSPETPTR